MNERPRPVDTPEPGYFLMRLVRGGPHVPAQIIQHADGQWQAVIDGEARGSHPDPAYAVDVFRIWHSGARTTSDEYHHRLRMKSWAQKNMPEHPAANPRKAITLTKLPPLI